jgi:hypothetical protein
MVLLSCATSILQVHLMPLGRVVLPSRFSDGLSSVFCSPSIDVPPCALDYLVTFPFSVRIGELAIVKCTEYTECTLISQIGREPLKLKL